MAPEAPAGDDVFISMLVDGTDWFYSMGECWYLETPLTLCG